MQNGRISHPKRRSKKMGKKGKKEAKAGWPASQPA